MTRQIGIRTVLQQNAHRVDVWMAASGDEGRFGADELGAGRLRPAVDLGSALEAQANERDVAAARGGGERRAAGPRASRTEIGTPFGQKQYRFSMAIKQSEIQGNVTVAVNLVRGASIETLDPYSQESADCRSISSAAGIVKLDIRGVILTVKRHAGMEGPRLLSVGDLYDVAVIATVLHVLRACLLTSANHLNT